MGLSILIICYLEEKNENEDAGWEVCVWGRDKMVAIV